MVDISIDSQSSWGGHEGGKVTVNTMPEKNEDDNGKKHIKTPFLIGDTSSHGWFFHCDVRFRRCNS